MVEFEVIDEKAFWVPKRLVDKSQAYFWRKQWQESGCLYRPERYAGTHARRRLTCYIACMSRLIEKPLRPFSIVLVCLLLTTVAMLSAGIGWGSGRLVAAAVYDKVTFPDPVLEQTVREAIGKPAGDIYADDLGLIKHNTLGLQGVSDLSGLEKCTALEVLFIIDCPVADLTPLSSLQHLQFLSLWSSPATDLTPVAGLSNLKCLAIYNNPVRLPPLSGLSNLETLSIIKSGITDISPLQDLNSLTNLTLAENDISDISALTGMSKLENLYLSDNNIRDISAIAGCTGLREFSCSNNQVHDITALTGLTALTKIYLDNNCIEDISSLAGLPSVQELNLADNRIQDITALGSFSASPGKDETGRATTLLRPALYYVNLKNNQIADLSPLLQNQGLRYDNRVTHFLFNGNPLSSVSLQQVLPFLKPYRVLISY